MDNKRLFRRFVDEIPNKGNVAMVDELVDEDAVYIFPGNVIVRGREALKATITERLSAVTDVNVSIEEMIGEGDRLVARLMLRLTTTGAGGTPAGKQLTGEVVHILRFENGRIVEDRQVADRLAELEQLGLAPTS